MKTLFTKWNLCDLDVDLFEVRDTDLQDERDLLSQLECAERLLRAGDAFRSRIGSLRRCLPKPVSQMRPD